MRRTRTATVLLGLLVAAAAAAFVRAEQLKLERSPVASPSIQKFFSATCAPVVRNCHRSHRATLEFRLREAATVALAIVDGNGNVVRTLGGTARRPRGDVSTRWDGRTGSGRLAHDGTYHLRIQLRSLGRTITVPDPLIVDNTAPVLALRSRPGELPIRYRLSERARVFAVATQEQTGRTPPPRFIFRGREGEVRFRATRRLSRGTPITVELVAIDPAGNRSPLVSVGGLRMPA